MQDAAHTLTIRDAFERYYRRDVTNANTLESYRTALSRWERLTPNPVLAEIDNGTVAEFRRAMIDAGLAAATINGTWRNLRPILRRVGPPMERNPWGEAIIDRVPAMRLVKETREFPRIFSHDELNRLYAACETRQSPAGLIPAPDWWRSLLVCGYSFGARTGDLLSLETSRIDWKRGAVKFLQSKTRAWHFVPLTEPARMHLRRIWSRRSAVFPSGESMKVSKAFYRNWNELLEIAGIHDDRVDFYTLRKTCGTFWDRVERGLGAYVLGHQLQGTAATYYLNVTDSLFEAAAKLEQPSAFLRIVKDLKLQRNVVVGSRRWKSTDWRFTSTDATFRDGRPLSLPPRLLRMLQVLVQAAGRPVSIDDARRLVFWDSPEASRTVVKTTMTQLRGRLRRRFNFGPYFDPVKYLDGRGYVLRIAAEDIKR